MSAVPTPVYYRQTRTIVCWGGDDTISLSVGGEIFHVPGYTKTFRADDKAQHRFLSALDEFGTPLSGTVELHDLSIHDAQEMVTKRVFDSDQAAEFIFGKDRSGRGGAYKEYCARGLRLASTPEQARAALAEGRRAWEGKVLESAYAICFRRSTQLQQAAQQHTVPPPEGPELRWAFGVLKEAAARGVKRDEISRDDLSSVLKSFTGVAAEAPVEVEKTKAPIFEVKDNPEISGKEAQEIQALDLIEAATEAGAVLSHEDIKGILAGDAAAIKRGQAAVMAAQARR